MDSNLVYVLSKVQFGKVTDSKFNAAVDTLIDELRKKYPVFSTQEAKTVEFTITPQGPAVNESLQPLLLLKSPSSDWGVRITPEYVLLHTKNYVSFEDFQERMEFLLQTVEKVLPIFHTKFIGIRYLNKFEWSEETDFNQYFKRKEFLQPDLEGVPSKAGSNLNCSYVIDTGVLTINSGVVVNQPLVPADLLEIAAGLDLSNQPLEGPRAHLDLDSFCNYDEMIEYDRGKALDVLAKLRSFAKNAYLEIVAEETS